jgi:DNA polymerase-3 subunit epsilon
MNAVSDVSPCKSKYAALDFETANYSRVSICAAGLAVFENGTLTESLYWLVRPPRGHGWFRDDFIECHGLTHLDVLNSPEFASIAPELLEHLARSDLVIAHNAEFDMGHLRGVLEHFGLACPEFTYLCTLQLARRMWPELPNHKLDTVAAHIGHTFNHHHAQSDAEAAGRVLLAMMRELGASTPEDLAQELGIEARWVRRQDVNA